MTLLRDLFSRDESESAAKVLFAALQGRPIPDEPAIREWALVVAVNMALMLGMDPEYVKSEFMKVPGYDESMWKSWTVKKDKSAQRGEWQAQ